MTSFFKPLSGCGDPRCHKSKSRARGWKIPPEVWPLERFICKVYSPNGPQVAQSPVEALPNEEHGVRDDIIHSSHTVSSHSASELREC